MLSYDLFKMKSAGKDLYMPIPYQKSCKVVADEGWGVYYHFGYSSFPKGTVVPTFSAALADWIGRQATSEEAVRWRKALLQPSPPRVYRSDVHRDARIHLGGIGTSNVEIGCDGQFTNWQLFNTLRDGHVPLSFVVNAGGVKREPTIAQAA
jgi:hypothetical protein